MHAKKYKIGLTFGAFCPLHYGHLNLFINAKQQCDRLIVCMSTDEYIKAKKGYAPPVPFDQRFMHLSAIRNEVVDFIDVQDIGFGKKEAIEKYRPDVLFVGNDWTPETYTGEGLGVPVIYLPHTEGISSTILREKMAKNKGLMV